MRAVPPPAERRAPGRSPMPGRPVASAVLLATLVLAACGEEVPPGAVRGDVIVSGSSTVEPISIAVAEKLDDEVPSVILSIDGPGTGDGFELFCDGETDLTGASRAIKEEEIESCVEAGVEWIELKVAIDGISVVTNPANDVVDCVNYADLYALVGPESQGVDSWPEAAPLADELGSETEFPSLPLSITAPGEESGTYDSFVEIVLEDLAEERDAHAEVRPDYQASGDDNVIVQGVQGAIGSLGWVGFAFAQEAADDVKQLAIAEEPGGECVDPTETTIADGSYPISRPLYVYVNAPRAAASPAVRLYVDHYLSDEGIVSVGEVGYVQLPPEELERTRRVWRERITGPAPSEVPHETVPATEPGTDTPPETVES